MTIPFPADAQPIDAVITWVDGDAPAHRAARARFMKRLGAPLHENAANPHRWANNDEILFCLRSIAAHAPWMRRIWIVVDGIAPDLTSLPATLRAKIRIADHDQIFAGTDARRPTFNSLAIETMLWRIEGLAERFVYFNDDVFLTAPLLPGDVFRGMAPVLRGKWVDYSALAKDLAARDDPAKFNHFMQINAAALMGYGADHLFAAAHVAHPMRRSVMAALHAEHPHAFANNIAHRFRDLSQFLPQGLHNHACLKTGGAVLHGAHDHLHIKSGQGIGAPPAQTQALLERAAGSQIKFLCVNDLPQLEQILPDARALIAQAIAPAA